MNLWLLVLTTFFGLRLVASPLDINDRASLDWALNDNPKSIKAWARKEFDRTDAGQDPRRWVRALWLNASLVTEWRAEPELRAQLEKGIIIAERENMREELLALKGFRPGIMQELAQGNDHDVDSKAVSQEYENLIAEARRLGVRRAEAEALTAYGFYQQDRGETTDGLRMLIEATKVLADDPTATELSRMNMKNNLSLAYAYQNQVQRAMDLYMEMGEFCARAKLRSFCLVNDYNTGKLMVDEYDATQWPKAEPYFLKSLQVAEEIDDTWSKATAHSGLLALHVKLGNFARAVQEAEIAIKLFKEAKNNVWLADTYKKGARAHLGAKRYQEALDYIAEAQRLFPEGYRRDFNDLEDLSYQVYRAMGQTEKALQHLEKHNAEFKIMSLERENAEYSKLKVGLGLQSEEEKNKLLLMDNALKNQKLAETERLRLFMFTLLGLSLLVMGSMGLAVARSREVRSSRTKMQRILSNIEEGILTINSQLEIDSEYSHYLNVLFNSEDDLSGRPALPLLLDQTTLKHEERSMVHEVLHASLGADRLQWLFNEHHLPMELIYPGLGTPRIVAIHWQPLYDRHARVQSFLIGLTDVTERRQLEAEIALQRQRSNRRTRIVPELAQAEAARVDALLAQAQALGTQFVGTEDAEARRGILRELHTIKGIARVLGLKELSAEVHDLEDRFQTLTDPHALAEQQKAFLGVIDDYLHVVQQSFSRRTPDIQAKRQLNDLLQTILPGVIEHMQSAGLELSSLTVVDRVMRWPLPLLETLEQILVHGLSNSVDHGFIFPRQRGLEIPEPAFHIEAQRFGPHVQLIVRDNGTGLDWTRLQQLAQKLNFQPPPGRSVADVVFLDGSTTAEQVSRTSGRGVGLAAIRSLCQEWGGDVRMEPSPEGKGAQLVATLLIQRIQAFRDPRAWSRPPHAACEWSPSMRRTGSSRR